MLKHLYLILIATFFVGFLSGVYIYFASNNFEEPKPRDAEVSKGFEIVGDAYGGCMRLGDCPSYRILESGQYTYIMKSREGEDKKFEDTISPKRISDLKSLLGRTDLALISDSEFSGTCPASFDGSAYKYVIILKGKMYAFDTCVEDTSNTPLFDTLADYFEIFRLVHDEE